MTDIDPDTGLTAAVRRRVEKAVLLPALLGAACLIAGTYGALHNQVSYTVSPDYFHAFKFRQFAVPAAHRDRWGAALAGWAASWWMGVLIGVPIIAPGVRLPGGRAFATRCLAGFALAAATAMAVGPGGAGVGGGDHHRPVAGRVPDPRRRGRPDRVLPGGHHAQLQLPGRLPGDLRGGGVCDRRHPRSPAAVRPEQPRTRHPSANARRAAWASRSRPARTTVSRQSAEAGLKAFSSRSRTG